MKTLSQFIAEAQWFDAFKTPERRRAITAAEFWTQNHSGLEPFKITSQKECRSFWAIYANWANRLGGGKFKDKRLADLGFANLDEMVSYVMDAVRDNSKDTEHVGFKELAGFFKECYELKRSAFKEAHDKFVASYGSGREIDEDYTGDDLNSDEYDHAVVCRSKYGDSPIMLYAFRGSWKEEHNQIKQTYVYDTGCNYYQARPILLKNWFKNPETKRATYQDGVDYIEDFE